MMYLNASKKKFKKMYRKLHTEGYVTIEATFSANVYQSQFFLHILSLMVKFQYIVVNETYYVLPFP